MSLPICLAQHTCDLVSSDVWMEEAPKFVILVILFLMFNGITIFS